MYDPSSLYAILGWVIIVLCALSVIALIVCLADRARWRREQNDYSTTSANKTHPATTKGQ